MRADHSDLKNAVSPRDTSHCTIFFAPMVNQPIPHNPPLLLQDLLTPFHHTNPPSLHAHLLYPIFSPTLQCSAKWGHAVTHVVPINPAGCGPLLTVKIPARSLLDSAAFAVAWVFSMCSK